MIPILSLQRDLAGAIDYWISLFPIQSFVLVIQRLLSFSPFSPIHSYQYLQYLSISALNEYHILATLNTYPRSNIVPSCRRMSRVDPLAPSRGDVIGCRPIFYIPLFCFFSLLFLFSFLFRFAFRLFVSLSNLYSLPAGYSPAHMPACPHAHAHPRQPTVGAWLLAGHAGRVVIPLYSGFRIQSWY